MSKSEEKTRLDPDWTEYIIEDMQESEMFENIPKMDGLRRMVEKHISPIINMEVNILPVVGQDLTVIAVCKTTLANGESYTACSDANRWSAGEVFRSRLTALADTRAKSKCFREILRINNVSSIEEIHETDDPECDGIVTLPQLMALKKHCIKIGADPEKAMQYFLADPPVRIDKMKVQQCVELMGKVDACLNGREETPEQILLGE